jgi:hypothetical protein
MLQEFDPAAQYCALADAAQAPAAAIAATPAVYRSLPRRMQPKDRTRHRILAISAARMDRPPAKESPD